MIDIKKIIGESETALAANPENAQAFTIYSLAKLLDFISGHGGHKQTPAAEQKTAHEQNEYFAEKEKYRHSLSHEDKEKMLAACRDYAQNLYSNTDCAEEREIFMQEFGK